VYGPHDEVTLAQIEAMEMGAIENAQKHPEHELPRMKDHVRAFWMRFDLVVGASNGETTNYIYVEWHFNGSVHGRPMTKRDLIRKGMQA
jgi:hypothetical protein